MHFMGSLHFMVQWCHCISWRGMRGPPRWPSSFPALPWVWRHCPKCPMAALGLGAEDGVHTTVRLARFEPRNSNGRIRCRQRQMWSWWSVCGPPRSSSSVLTVSCYSWGVGALPQCPMAALAAEDDVHTTVRHPNHNLSGRIRCREHRA